MPTIGPHNTPPIITPTESDQSTPAVVPDMKPGNGSVFQTFGAVLAQAFAVGKDAVIKAGNVLLSCVMYFFRTDASAADKKISAQSAQLTPSYTQNTLLVTLPQGISNADPRTLIPHPERAIDVAQQTPIAALLTAANTGVTEEQNELAEPNNKNTRHQAREARRVSDALTADKVAQALDAQYVLNREAEAAQGSAVVQQLLAQALDLESSASANEVDDINGRVTKDAQSVEQRRQAEEARIDQAARRQQRSAQRRARVAARDTDEEGPSPRQHATRAERQAARAAAVSGKEK